MKQGSLDAPSCCKVKERTGFHLEQQKLLPRWQRSGFRDPEANRGKNRNGGLPICGSDSDPLRQRLRRRGIELIVPDRENNQHRRYQDGRKLRRYPRRWIVERTRACLSPFRWLLVRHEYLPTYRAVVYLACFWITLRRCF